MQADPIKPLSKPPGTKPFNLKYDESLSGFAFNFNLRRYIEGIEDEVSVLASLQKPKKLTITVRRCRLPLSNPRRKRLELSA